MPSSSRSSRLSIALCLATVAGCGSSLRRLEPNEYHDLVQHSVFIDGDGRPLRPDTTGKARAYARGDSAHWGEYLGGIMRGIRGSGRHEILVRIHGGMNSLDEQITGNMEIANAISEDAAHRIGVAYYPLFVNWESSIQRSYLDHLFFVRQGTAYRGGSIYGPWISPFYFAADVGRAVTRAPIVWGIQGANFYNQFRLNDTTGLPPEAQQAHEAATRKMASVRSVPMAAPSSPRAVTLELAPYHRSHWEKAVDFTAALVSSVVPVVPFVPYPRHKWAGQSRFVATTLPSHFLYPRWRLFSPWMIEHVSLMRVPLRPFSAVVVDVAGREGYANMRRRTRTAFHDANEFSLPAHADGSAVAARAPTGAIAQFLDSLAFLTKESQLAALGRSERPDSVWLCYGKRRVPDSLDAQPYRLTIVGHSMGTSIAAEMLQSCPTLKVRNIVFMAGAATVRETEQSVIPYLESHSDARFYNLTLHPKSDLGEWPHRLFFSTQGSLLAWVDGFLYAPETDADRTIGRYENAVSALHLIPDSVQSRVYLKGFGYHAGQDERYYRGEPFHHGDFSDWQLHFWRCEFWTPKAAIGDCSTAAPVTAAGAGAPAHNPD